MSINHSMHLPPRYLQMIRDGRRIIELRIRDEKRKLVQPTDSLVLVSSENEDDVVMTDVVGILVYQTFQDLVEDVPLSWFGDEFASKQDLLDFMGKIYTKAEEEQHGVIAFRIRPV